MKTLSKCRLKIGLLGPFYLTVNETEIRTDAWKSKKALTLLKYCATRAGQNVSADVLIELLWPDNEDRQHGQSTYSRLVCAQDSAGRGKRRRGTLLYANGSYWLELPEECFDIHLFQKHVKKSRQLAKSSPEQALSHCESALALYRDDFLPEDLYEEWTISYREEFQELYFETIVRSAELLMPAAETFKGL